MLVQTVEIYICQCHAHCEYVNTRSLTLYNKSDEIRSLLSVRMKYLS